MQGSSNKCWSWSTIPALVWSSRKTWLKCWSWLTITWYQHLLEANRNLNEVPIMADEHSTCWKRTPFHEKHWLCKWPPFFSAWGWQIYWQTTCLFLVSCCFSTYTHAKISFQVLPSDSIDDDRAAASPSVCCADSIQLLSCISSTQSRNFRNTIMLDLRDNCAGGTVAAFKTE